MDKRSRIITSLTQLLGKSILAAVFQGQYPHCWLNRWVIHYHCIFVCFSTVCKSQGINLSLRNKSLCQLSLKTTPEMIWNHCILFQPWGYRSSFSEWKKNWGGNRARTVEKDPFFMLFIHRNAEIFFSSPIKIPKVALKFCNNLWQYTNFIWKFAGSEELLTSTSKIIKLQNCFVYTTRKVKKKFFDRQSLFEYCFQVKNFPIS